jgi:hypothetical protein
VEQIEFLEQAQKANWARKKLQISPLRCAPVEMTILLGNAQYRFQDELSSRPERSGVERSAVSFLHSKRSHYGNANAT